MMDAWTWRYGTGTMAPGHFSHAVACHRLKEAKGSQRPMTTPSSPPPPAAASASASASRLEIVLFFFSGLGSSLCYIATLSSLVFYKSTYGAQSYIYINLAVFLPLLPIAIAQARYDQDVDRLVGSANAFLCRGIVGYVLSIGALASIPLRSDGGLIFVCLPAIIIGFAGAILQGILYQMASFVSANCAASTQSLKASVAAGIQASALVALLVSVGTGFGSSADDTVDDLRRFNAVICLLETCIMGLFMFLMIRSRRISHAMVQRDSSISLVNDFFNPSGDSISVNGPETPDETPLLQGAEDEDDECSGNSSSYEEEDPDRPPASQSDRELTYRQIWKYSSRCFTSLLLTLAPSFLAASWFTKVQTEVMMLPQILFYVRIISDFSSRLLTVYKSPASQTELLTLACCRLVLVVVFFVNATYPVFPHRDALSIALVCIIAFGSGYLVTGTYQLAPSALPGRYRERNTVKQAAALNLGFAVSALLGLFVSLSLYGLGL